MFVHTTTFTPCVPLYQFTLYLVASTTICQSVRDSIEALLTNMDVRSEEIHANILNVVAKKQYATVARVAGAGHLVSFYSTDRLVIQGTNTVWITPRYRRCSPQASLKPFGLLCDTTCIATLPPEEAVGCTQVPTASFEGLLDALCIAS